MMKMYGIRINVIGGVSSTREMLRTASFQRLVQAIKRDGLDIRMVPSTTPAEPSCFLLGIPYSIENENDVDPITVLPDGIDSHEVELRQFLEDHQIPIIGDMRGVVCAGSGIPQF